MLLSRIYCYRDSETESEKQQTLLVPQYEGTD